MRHLLEIDVRLRDSETRLPEVHGFNEPSNRAYRLPLTTQSLTTLTGMARMEIEELRRNHPNLPIANINPFTRHIASPFFGKLLSAVDTAGATAFGSTPTQTQYIWKCENENNRAIVSPSEVYASAANPNEFRAFCGYHAAEEVVSLTPVTNPDEVAEEEEEEPEDYIGDADSRVRVIRPLPTWLFEQYMDEPGVEVNVGNEGRILWNDNLYDPNGNRLSGYYVQLDAGYEVHLPANVLGAAIT